MSKVSTIITISLSLSMSMVYGLCWDKNPIHCCCGFTMTTFVLSTPSIRVDPVGICCISYYLSQTWGWDSCCLYTPPAFAGVFNFGAQASISLLPLNLFFFFLLSLQYLSKFVILSYHCFILMRECSDFINLFLITLFIPLLNFSTNSLLLYPFLLATFWNFCTNFFIVQLSCFTFFNSTTFIILLSPLPNSFFKSIKNSPTVIYSNSSFSKFFMIFFFQISANPLCTYDNTH